MSVASRRTVARRRAGAITITIRSSVGILVALYILISSYPFVLMLSGSLKSRQEVIANPWPWPREFTLDTLRETWKTLNFGTYLLNSVVIAGGTCALALVLFPLAAYAFAVLRFPLRRTLFSVFIASIFVPGVTVLLPVVLLDFRLGLLGSPWAVILPLTNGAAPVAILLLKAAFDAIPRYLRESAILDGCSEWSIYWRIYLPLARSGLVTIALLNFVASWNEYVLPSVTNDDPSLYPLPVGLQNLVSTSVVQWNQVMAGSLLLGLPVILVFLALQRYFINGLQGSIKG